MKEQQLSFYEEAKSIAEAGSVEEKVALTARKNIPPEILYYLASDSNPQVRAAVAACRYTPHQADLILADDADPRVKESLIQKVAALGEGLNRVKNLARVEKLDQIMDKLAQDESVSIRRLFAQAVKRLACLSRNLVMMMARDEDEEVSKTIIRSSPVLEEEDLTVLLKTRNGPLAKAVAARDQVSEAVSAEVVEVDFSPAVTQLLSNKAARLSAQTMNLLADKAPQHEEWHEPFSHREELSLDVIKKLSLIVSNSLIKVMIEKNYLEPTQLQDVMATVKHRIESGDLDTDVLNILVEPPQPYQSAYDRAKDDYLKGILNEEKLLSMLEALDRCYVIGGVAVLARLPYQAVLKAVNTQSGRALMAMSWKAGLSPRTGVELQRKLALMIGTKVVLPQDDEYPLSESDMEWQLELFSDMADEG